MNDPEAQRVNELLDRAALGQASPAERTELALYTQEHPDLAGEAARRVEQARLGAGWIERLDADAKIARVEQSRLTKIEQGMGIALTFGGAGLAFVSPILGSLVIFLGLALTIWSVIRVRLGTFKDDPYRKVKR